MISGKKIVDTRFVVIIETTDLTKLRVFIAMSKGGWIEHNEFDNNLMGLTAAMQLATECCAGKFFLKQVATNNDSVKMIGHK